MAADGVRTEAEEYAASAAIYCSLGPEHALAAFSGHMQLGDTYSMLGQLDRSIACYADGLHIPPTPESPRPRLAGNVISFGLFLSPSPTFYGIFKRKTTEQFKPDPYLATVMSCMLWVFYGMPFVHPNSLLVVTINSIGLALEGIYLTIYFVYGSKSQRLKVFKFLALEFGTMALIVVLVLTLAHTYAKRTLIVGILCVIFGTCMYASPLTVMRNVIRTKSVRFMPFYLSLANFSNGVCWTIYGLIEFDVNILIPNGLGGIFGAIQLILYACYYSSTTWEDEVDDKQQTELGPLPTTNPSSVTPQVRRE